MSQNLMQLCLAHVHVETILHWWPRRVWRYTCTCWDNLTLMAKEGLKIYMYMLRQSYIDGQGGFEDIHVHVETILHWWPRRVWRYTYIWMLSFNHCQVFTEISAWGRQKVWLFLYWDITSAVSPHRVVHIFSQDTVCRKKFLNCLWPFFLFLYASCGSSIVRPTVSILWPCCMSNCYSQCPKQRKAKTVETRNPCLQKKHHQYDRVC